MADTNFSSGAVRSADVDQLSFTGLPLLGLLGAMRTSGEGEAKYGKYNYMRGMPLHSIIDHVITHYIQYLCGDRSEPHLEHASWGALFAVESALLFPDLNAPCELGPGRTITPAMQARFDKEDPILAAKRASGDLDHLANWKLDAIPLVEKMLKRRSEVLGSKEFRNKNEDVKQAIQAAIAQLEKSRQKDFGSTKPEPDSPTWQETLNRHGPAWSRQETHRIGVVERSVTFLNLLHDAGHEIENLAFGSDEDADEDGGPSISWEINNPANKHSVKFACFGDDLDVDQFDKIFFAGDCRTFHRNDVLRDASPLLEYIQGWLSGEETREDDKTTPEYETAINNMTEWIDGDTNGAFRAEVIGVLHKLASRQFLIGSPNCVQRESLRVPIHNPKTTNAQTVWLYFNIDHRVRVSAANGVTETDWSPDDWEKLYRLICVKFESLKQGQRDWVEPRTTKLPGNPWVADLVAIKKLEKGWNGYDAPAPTDKQISNAWLFLDELVSKRDVPFKSVGASAVGAVAIKLANYRTNGLVYVEAFDDEYLLMVDEGKDSANPVICRFAPLFCDWDRVAKYISGLLVQPVTTN